MTSAASKPPSLDRFRSYLALLARWHWNPRLQGKLDPSDVVQQTLFQAWQGLDGLRGQSDAELRTWLRQILTRCLADWARDFGRQKRDVGRELSLQQVVEGSSVRLEAWLDDQQSSPVDRAGRSEELAVLAEALATLPDSQQEAVTLHHLHGLSIEEISELMGRSRSAVGGLLKRGLHALRVQLESGSQS